MNGRILRLTHLLQGIFGRYAPVHQPNPPRFAVLVLNLLQKALERGFVAGVARQHFVGQRKTLRRDHQRNHHLHTIRTLVPAVTKLPFVVFRKRRIALKIGAGQIIEQHVESDAEEILPALLEKAKQSGLVLRQLIQTPIEIVLGRQAEIFVQQIPHRAPAVPLPVQAPFAARINPTIRAKDDQDVIPGGVLPAGGQTLAPELAELQLLPKEQKDPASPPLPRPTKAELRQADLHPAGRGVSRNGLVAGKECQLGLVLRLHVEH